MTTKNTGHRVGFIGAGRMATALAKGLSASRFTSPDLISAADVSPDALERFAAETGARGEANIANVVHECEILIYAVKPQHLPEALDETRPHVTPDQLVVSIAAGVPIAALHRSLGDNHRIVRVMPNTPCLVGAGASAFALGAAATQQDGQLVHQLLSTVGIAFEVAEPLLDAVTGLSGSGPAFVYQVIEALSDGGVRAGLPREIATKLAAQTVLGAAQMVLQTGQHPGALKDEVTSPGGTTIAGLHALENGGLRGCLMDAVQAATRRSCELGQSS